MKIGKNGFTLIEVLVALSILALGLAAASRVSTTSSDASQALRDRQLALWIAEDQLSWLRAARTWPEVGITNGTRQMAGIDFAWRMQVTATAATPFRRIEVSVSPPAPVDAAALVQLVGYLERP